MSQSAIIAAALLAGFVLFLAARNRLPTYAAVLWGPGAQVPSPGAVAASTGAGAAAGTVAGATSALGPVGDLLDVAGLVGL